MLRSEKGRFFLRNRLRVSPMKKKLTLKDLAIDLGVSTATVSRALSDSYEISEQVKKKIRDYAQAVGYQPDRTATYLRKGTTSTIGLVIPSIAYNFNVQLIKGIERVLQAKGYRLLIFQTLEQYKTEMEAIEYLLSIRVDGIIASVAATTKHADHFKAVIKQEKPLVFVDRICSGVEASQVVIDHEMGSYLAVKHLLEIGCRHIAWIPGPRGLFLSKQRQKGYEKALNEYGVPVEKDLICYCTFHTDMGYQDTRKHILAHPEIDGIYVINDRIALGVMAAIRSLKRKIPDDIAVVGFNNEPMDPLLNPSLSSVYQPAEKMGADAGKLMLKHIKSRTFTPEKHVFDTDLIIRDSSGRRVRYVG